jgi:hypothetical protein
MMQQQGAGEDDMYGEDGFDEFEDGGEDGGEDGFDDLEDIDELP